MVSNLTEWNSFYDGARRQSNCDLTFLTLFYRFALKEKDIKTALVLGAGDGVEAFELARNGIAVTATDFSEVSVARMKSFVHAEKNPLIMVEQMDQRDVAKAKGAPFDAVVSWSTLSYLSFDDALGVVAGVRKILSPGGVFIVLFEDFESDLRTQAGVIQTGHNQYRLPPTSRVNPNLEMTFFTDSDVRTRFAAGYSIVAASARSLFVPPDATFNIAQRMYVFKATAD